MNIDIEDINTFEKINKVYTTQQTTIYKVIEPYFSTNLIFFPDDFIKKCKDNANEAINIPIEVKNNIKQMATEQVLYAQVVKLYRKGF